MYGKWSLKELVRKANEVSAQVLPHTCKFLRILTAINDYECNERQSGQVELDSLTTPIAERTGIESWLVRLYLRRHVWADLNDYSGSYDRYVQAFREKDFGEVAYQRLLEWNGKTPERSFVWYEMVYRWFPDEELIGPLIFRDPHDSSDRLYLSLHGYLIVTGRVYPRAIQLLEDSYQQRWPNWQLLWEKEFNY